MKMSIDHVMDKKDHPPPAVARVEILFDDDSPLKGMKLTGIEIWPAASGGLRVILPDNLRTVIHPASERVLPGTIFKTVSQRVVQAVEEEILEEYRKALTET